MASVEVSRTLAGSPPELWDELCTGRLAQAIGDVRLRAIEPEESLAWEGDSARGEAVLEPSSQGTKVTLRAELEETVARRGLWARLSRRVPEPPEERGAQLEQSLDALLDELGSNHRQPSARD